MILSSFLFLQSCAVIDRIVHFDNYVKKDFVVKEKEYLYDTVYLSNTGGPELELGNNIKPSKRLILNSIGNKVTIRKGEKVELVFDGLDANNSSIVKSYNPNTQEMTISIGEQIPTIYFENECQVYTIDNIESLPKIKLKDGLITQQIIITPLVDDDCNQTGYEIRYGSEENGCKIEAKKNLKRFSDCYGKNRNKNERKQYKISDPDCITKKKLGFPCK